MKLVLTLWFKIWSWKGLIEFKGSTDQTVRTAIVSNCYSDLPRWYRGRESTCQWRRCKRRGFHPWVRKIHWSGKWQPAPVFLPGNSDGQRSLVCYSPWGLRVEQDSVNKNNTPPDLSSLEGSLLFSAQRAMTPASCLFFPFVNLIDRPPLNPVIKCPRPKSNF